MPQPPQRPGAARLGGGQPSEIETGKEKLATERLEDACQELEEELEELKVKYDMFFLGVERIEPARRRDDLKRAIARLKNAFTRNAGLRFRIQALHARYLAYERLWLRSAREKEEGTYRRDIVRARRKAAAGARRDGKGAAPARPRALPLEPEDVDLGDLDAAEEAEVGPSEGAATAGGDAASGAGAESLEGPTQAEAQAAARPEGRATLPPGEARRTPPATAPPPARAPPAGSPSTRTAEASARGGSDATRPADRMAAPPASAAPPRPAPTPQPARATPPSASTPGPSAPGLSEAQMRALYDAYVSAKKRCNEDVTKVTYESVAKSVAKQIPEISARYNAREVEFKVVIKEGKAVLKAVPKT